MIWYNLDKEIIMDKFKKITVDSLNSIDEKMRSGPERYAVDEKNGFFNDAFKKFPLNNEPEIVIMKMSLIDATNSTNLGRILGNKDYVMNGRQVKRRVFTLSDLVEEVVSMRDFDERVEAGDVSLVNELAVWGKERGANIMSFFSKYCLYHNYIVYDKDDYSIFDSVVQRNLGKYITEEEFEVLFPGRKLRSPKEGENISDVLAKTISGIISSMKDDCDYESYHKLIGDILELKKIDEHEVPKMRRKLDHLVWYINR